MSSQPYHDPSLPVEERVTDLLARMTLEEKAGQLTQYFYLNQNPGQQAGPGEDAARLSAVDEALANGRVGSLLFVRTASETNRLQRVAIEGHRLRIPVLFGYDVIHGLRTGLPVPIALAASWDPQIIEAGQTVAAREARAVGIHWAFAPMVDIARDPRWGRIVEGAGEDPCLGSAVPRSAAFRATWARSGSWPAPNTSPGTAPRSVVGTTTTPTSPTPSCGTSTCRRSRPRSRREPKTS